MRVTRSKMHAILSRWSAGGWFEWFKPFGLSQNGPREGRFCTIPARLEGTVVFVRRPWIARLLMAIAIAAKLCAANGWERLSEIRSGDVVRVIQVDRKEYHGTFVRL